MTGDGRDDLWEEVIDLANVFADWVLVGGLMVSLWARHSGVQMTRTTDDIDALFRAEAYLGQPQRSVEAILRRGYRLDEGHPVDTLGKDSTAFRFHRDGITLDVLVPDKFATANNPPRTVPPYVPSMVPGGSYALRHYEVVEVVCNDQAGPVPIASPLGGLLMKRRAQQADTGAAAARHGDDIAVLWAAIPDPLAVDVSKNERKVLRGAASNAHWGVLGADAEEAGRAAADLILND
ncbi:MAG: hypothetical protein ACI867_002104 [Glaciecola sp.]|jgi:hypothetical protein